MSKSVDALAANESQLVVVAAGWWLGGRPTWRRRRPLVLTEVSVAERGGSRQVRMAQQYFSTHHSININNNNNNSMKEGEGAGYCRKEEIPYPLLPYPAAAYLGHQEDDHTEAEAEYLQVGFRNWVTFKHNHFFIPRRLSHNSTNNAKRTFLILGPKKL